MKTVLEILTLTAEHLKHKGIQNSRRQAEDLLADVLDLKRMDLYLQFDRPLVPNEIDLCRQWLARRAKGEPLAYIKGAVDFFDCCLKVTRDVLIPRQETEILVDKICQQLTKQPLTGKKMWDVCCGSGCIGIALKKRFPELQVTLSDISTAALNIAKENAIKNQVEIEFYQGDLLKPFEGKKTDYLVCNPPYVSENDFATLDREVRDFEPKLALTAEFNGLEFYQRLAKDLPAFFHSGGKAWFEIGDGQGELVKNLFKTPPFKSGLVECDWAGRERFFSLEIE